MTEQDREPIDVEALERLLSDAEATPAPWWVEGHGGITMGGRRDTYELPSILADVKELRALKREIAKLPIAVTADGTHPESGR